MNNEISSKSLSLSSVDATLAAIIPDTPIVSIAGSTLSEITTTTTSTTTTPTPTPTSNETNRADISSSSSSSAEATIEQQPPSMSGASQKITGIATNRAAATAPVSVTVSAKLTSTSISTTTSPSTSTPQTDNNTTATSNDLDAINNVVDEEPASTPSIVSASLNTSITTENIDGASNSQHHERITKNHQITSSNTTDELSSIGNNNTTGATTKSSQSLTGNTKSETNTTDKKSKDSELWEEEKFTNLDDQNLKLLLEEAYSYRSPTDKENKSELFLSLLEKAENEKEDITLCRMPTSSRLKRISYTTHGNHLQQNHHNHHQRHKHGGSLQDLDEAVRNESILDPDYIFSSSCGQRNRRNNHNSRQKKYSTVSSRQREGGSLPNNVNFTNCARLFGGGGVGGIGGIGGNAVGDVAGLTPIEQFPFMHEMNTVCSGTIASNTVASGGAPASSNANSASDSTNNNSNNTTTGNGCKQRRNAARTNLMSSAATSSIGAASGASNNEGEQMVGQPIGVLIGGQVITQRSSNTSMAANIGNEAAANSSTFNTGNRTLKDTICSVNVSDCVIEMGETILDVQQQQRIMQSKSQEGRVFYDRLENVDVMPRANMMTTIPARTNYAPNTANAYVDDKVHFTALRNYNPCAAATASGGGGAGGTKPIQSGAVDTKYLPLGDDYKAYKSVLAIADKEDMREVDENGNAVTEPFSVNTTTTHAAATGTVYNSINVTTNAPVISGAQASASAGSGTSSSSAQATKSKSKKQPKQERNVTTVNLETVAGYRGFDPVEKLVEYIESSTGGDDSKLSKQKKERKKQEKQDKHNNKIKKSNSLEELRSCAKMEVDELKRTAATTESNVMMRNKGKGGGAKNNSSSVADINKNFDSNNGSGSGSSSSNTSSAVVTKEKSGNASAVISTNRKGERRSWGTEELQYLGDANSVANNIAIVTTQSASDEKIKDKDKDKERKSKNRESQKDDKDNKPKSEKVEKNDTEIINSQTVLPNTITTVKANVVDKSEKQQQQPQPPQQQQHIDKAEKRKKGDIQQTKSSIAGNIIAETTVPVVDILAMESLLPETAEFHVVTKKKKTKKQRSPIEETNGNNNNPNSKSNNNFVNAANLKGGNTNQSNRFNNAKSNTNEHFSNGNHYQHHNSNNNNHHHNQQSQQQQHHHHQQQQQQQQHQNQQQNQQKNDKSRRKSTSSVPPSEKSDSSDLDSVHSLPIEKAAKVSGGGAASSNPNATTKNANANAKQARQSSKNNTAGGVATAMSQPQKAPQVQQLPTPFSYAEIAKEAKSLKATLSVTANTVNNNNNNTNNNTEQAENISSQPHQQQQQQQTHPPATSTDEPKTTLARAQQSATHSAATGSITLATTSTPPSSSAGLTHSSNHHSNHHSNHPTKPHKVKKSMAKPDFPALGSASEVAVAASAARADIFAKAVLNSSQPPIAVPNPQQANENVTLLTAPKSTITEQPKEASHQQHPPQQHTPLVQQHQQQHGQQQQHQHQHQQQQYQQQQQTLQKSKSVDPEASNNVAINVNNKNYSNTMDHQQYPALKTVKRHSASNFSTLPPSIATTTQSTTNAGQQPPPQQQQHSMNSIPTPINFAAAARQTLITKNNPNIEMLPTTSTETTTSNVTTATTTAAMPKKNTAPVKEKAIVGSSNVSSPNTASPNENYNKKNKRDKQQQQQQQTVTSVNLSRKSTAATQTSVAQPNVVSKSSTRSTVVIPSAISTSAVSSMPQSLIIPAINRPAVIILNDDAVGISSDFTFGDFNEDELHFFDDENEEYTTATGTATATNDELMEVHSLPPQLTSSSPRSCSLSVGSLQQLNDSVGNQQQADDIILTSSDVTLSPNNSVSIPANDNQQQHNNSGGAAGIASSGNTSNSSSHCIANASEQSNYSADSGIYNSAAKANESAVVVDVTTNVNTFLQQHISVMNNNPIANDMDNLMTELTETQPQAPRQHQQQQLETCNEIESVIFAAARRAATQQQQQQQQHPQLQHQQMSHTKCSASSTTNANYQHSNSNSSSFSSSSSVDGGMNKYYSAAQSPPPSTQPTQQQQQQLQQQQQVHYYNRQAYPPYTTPVQHQQQMYPQNYNMLATSHHHQGIVAPVNMMYSRSNSDCDDEYVSPPPPPGTYMVKIQNKEYDLHYLPPNNSTNVDSQNELIVDYVSSVWNDVCNSKYTRIYDGQ